jgi:hypothetical protein
VLNVAKSREYLVQHVTSPTPTTTSTIETTSQQLSSSTNDDSSFPKLMAIYVLVLIHLMLKYNRKDMH